MCLVVDYLIKTIRREDSYRMGPEERGRERKRGSAKLQLCKDRPKAGGFQKLFNVQ